MEMTHLIAYRGPSGFGFAYAGRNRCEPMEVIHGEDRATALRSLVVGLGNHRLAILDISHAGNMPMQTDDGAYCLTYNGEIYNYKEIRQELEQRGHRFRTQTDTEVILHSYQEWGEECLQKFNGMWSFALWDHSRQNLFCARDRFGVKPFYYAVHGGRFYFGSEIKQILQASRIPRVAKSRVVSYFLEWGLTDYSANTFFENIYQLPGGHWLKLDLSEPLTPVIGRYWELRLAPRPELPTDEAIQEFRHRFQNAVRLRLRSDVPVGVSLSGGLDSSAVLCQAKQIAPEIQFQTFSACFDDPQLDEREYVSAAIEAAGAVSHLVFTQAEDFWCTIESMIYHHDEPILNTSAFAQWSVMREARQHGIPVMLGGQGADETLCGYQKYPFFYLWQLLREADSRFFRQAAMWILQGTSSYWTLDSAVRYLPDMVRRKLSLMERVGTIELREGQRQDRPQLGSSNGVAERQKMDLVYSSIPALLHYEDRNSMAHSVESRLPFLDYELVEFSVNCPSSLKLRDGWSKWILRNALVDSLPEKIRLRKTKLGFDTPDAVWVRAGLQNGHRGLWEAPKLRMERFMNADRLGGECRNFLRGGPAALPSALIFRAISLELWARTYVVS
jgi:asparagine synthase (glutamine-hydrolysing)